MGMDAFFERSCTQTAVYWGTPVSDGYGSFTFADPVEIKVRWEEKQQILGSTDGVQLISRAIVFLLQDVDTEGCLYLGTLESLDDYLDSSGGTYIDPRDVPDICLIKRFEKTPRLGSTSEFLRKAFLTPWLT